MEASSEASAPFLSARSVTSPTFNDIDMQEVSFPWSKSFQKLSAKEKENAFLRAFDEKLAFIRSKELKCVQSPIQDLYSEEELNNLKNNKSSALEAQEASECRKRLTQRFTKTSSEPPLREESNVEPTYDPYLNVNFSAQFELLEKFKQVLSEKVIDKRAKARTQKLSEYLQNHSNSTLRMTAKSTMDRKLTPQSLLNVDPFLIEDKISFSGITKLSEIPCPEISIEPHSIERPFDYYEAHIVEKYNLTPFQRTEVNAFIAIPVTPPDRYPVVTEEQPIRERTVNLDSEESKPQTPPEPPISTKSSKALLKKVATTSQVDVVLTVMPLSKTLVYPRDVKFLDDDPSEQLQAFSMKLPDIDSEIGRSSILAMPLSAYQTMFLNPKSARVAPFTFTGITNPKLKPMSGPNEDDLRELSDDDDVDNLDVKPKTKPVTDFLQKPPATTNKSHDIAAAVVDGQAKWREREAAGVKSVIDKLNKLNNMMSDKSLAFQTNDLESYFDN